MDKIKITIIGTGVVGLAIAVELSREYEDIVVLEKHGKFGQETSSRYSEVIHFYASICYSLAKACKMGSYGLIPASR